MSKRSTFTDTGMFSISFSILLFLSQEKNKNPKAEGNIRDVATLEQLVVLSNMESINALLIQQGVPSPERILQLNQVAIMQMKSIML